ncbi:MAG: ABC transporter substrate-binding protein [Nitrospirae bacterium]|nr:ABC transporter substrate-binding protein [Nitrospirota bacterium]
MVAVVLAGGLVGGNVLGWTATAWAGPPTDAVKKSVDEVIRILENPDWKKPEKKEDRRKLLEQTIAQRFNFTEMAKRSLGAEWAKRTPEEQKEFAANFQTLLANTYIGRIEAYSGEKVQYLKELNDGEYAETYTHVDTGKSVIDINYRMQKTEDWRVYDVVVEGTSLVLNYREQFKRILRKDSFAELSKQLRDKSSSIKAPVPDGSDTAKSR